MQDRVFQNPKISLLWNSSITDFIGDVESGGLKSVKVKNTKDGSISDLKCDGAFIAIGHKPNSSILVDQIELDKSGYVITKSDSTLTSIPGIFAAGDLQDTVYRQAITAAGSGCMAAMDAEKYLESLH